MQLFLHDIFYGENFIGQVKVPLYLVCLNLNHDKQNSSQNGKVEKMVVLAKTFDHYRLKFQLFQLFFKIVKEFETEMYIEI